MRRRSIGADLDVPVEIVLVEDLIQAVCNGFAALRGRSLVATHIDTCLARMGGLVPQRKIIVSIATSADGYVARPDGNLDWLTERPAPKGFYGLPEFERSIDAKILGRKTFDRSLQMGARFSAGAVHYVFSRRAPTASVPAGVHFVTESIAAFAERLRTQAGKNVWMMGGGEIIGSFLDEDAIDEFIITVVPTFIGKGIPLLAPRHREVALRLLGVQRFQDGVVQLHYEVQRSRV